MNTEASLPTLRLAVENLFHPRRLVLRRGHGGLVDLRLLADDFAETEDPLGLLNERLAGQGLRLPERTLTLLKSPDELEEGDEAMLFSQAPQGTPNWADALVLEPGAPEADDRGLPPGVKTVAFWGLKGGVGRSTALAHVALLLGRRGVRVLAVDLDLESPALVGNLTGDLGSGPRFESLVRLAGDPAVTDEALVREVQRALLPAPDASGQVEVLGPVQADIPFVQALLGPLAANVLYAGARPPLRRLLLAAVQASGAEIVLLDARSGYCDESAAAVLDLADEVVLFASPAPSTYPSLEPAVAALERSRLALGRPDLVHVVAGMLPAGEEARGTCLEELGFNLTLARGAVADRLKILDESLSPELSIISLDYSARIVENDGGLAISGLAEGYRELADRLLPPPLPRVFNQVDARWAAQVISEARVPVPQAESEDDTGVLAELFTRTADLDRFIRQDTFFVLGAKGTGKSFLRRICLEQPALLGIRAGVPALADTLCIEGYASPRSGRGASPPASQHLLRELDRRFPTRWTEVWSVLALGRVGRTLCRGQAGTGSGGRPDLPLCGDLGDLFDAPDEQGVMNAVAAILARDRPLWLGDAWRALDAWCEKSGRRVTLLFDDLDVALGESQEAIERRRYMILGLLDQANASWVPTRHVGAKVFLRKDIFDGLGTEEQAKYRARAALLTWKVEDIWRLIVRAMAAASPLFRKQIEQSGLVLAELDRTPKEDYDEALALIWGERLGAGESNTRSTVWAEKRLRDGNGSLFPRAALWLLDAAVEARKSDRIDAPPLLDPRSLRDAMPKVAENRLDELLTESGEAERQRILHLQGFKSYQDRQDFIAALGRAGELDAAAALATLESLGIVEKGARRDKTPTVRIVDLYAFAPRLRIERLGRR